ncbi:cytochrome c [Novosphingobium sp. FKTRR1]|uniref:c-type cytochrome n=1 Tax=unclassified Novosphingobium TaxID=2644732 RepID=UPI001CF000BD|nr:cytochrome c [Novosphingobium sp. FKTRR1]
MLALVGAAPAPRVSAAREAGGKTYAKWCGDCHSTPTGPGSLSLQRKYNGALPAILDQRTDLSPALIAYAVRHGASFMPSFRKTEISDAQVAEIGAYLTSPHRKLTDRNGR